MAAIDFVNGPPLFGGRESIAAMGRSNNRGHGPLQPVSCCWTSESFLSIIHVYFL